MLRLPLLSDSIYLLAFFIYQTIDMHYSPMHNPPEEASFLTAKTSILHHCPREQSRACTLKLIA